MSETNAPPPRRKRRIGIWVLLILVVLAGVLVVAALSFTGRMVAMPAWVNARVEQQLNKAIAPITVGLGGVDVFLSQQGVPQVHLRDIVLIDAQTRPIARLPELTATLVGSALLQRKILLKNVALRDARVTLRRNADGFLDLALGEADATVGQAESLVEVLDQIDTALTAPVLEAVENIAIEQLSLTYSDARAGRSWRVQDGLMTLEQTEDDVALQVFFSLRNDRGVPSEVALSFSKEKNSHRARMSANFSDMPAVDIATQSPALAFLTVLDAPISGAVRTGVTAEGELGPLNAALEIGEGALEPVEGARAIRFDGAKSYFQYDPDLSRLTFDQIGVETDGLKIQANGHAYLRDFEEGWPSSLITQMRFTEVAVNPAGMLDAPAVFSDGALDLKVTLDPFTANIGQAVLINEAGAAYRGSGKIRADADGWELGVDANMDVITSTDLLAIWPPDVVPGTRRWISTNVVSGTFYDVRAALRLAPNQNPRVSLTHEFRDATVRFMKTMPPIENGFGYAAINDNTFTLNVDAGQISAPQGGLVNVAGSVMQIEDIRLKRPPGVFTLHTDSQIAPLLSLLDLPPLNIMTKAGRAPDLAEGRAEMVAKIALDLKKDVKTEEVIFSVDGTLRDVISDQIVPGRILTAKSLSLNANNEEVTVSGSAQLDGVPFTGSWYQPIAADKSNTSQVDGTVEISKATLNAFNIALPDGMVSGAGRGSVAITLEKDKAPQFTLKSNLNGLGLNIAGTGWRKAPSASGNLTVAGSLGKPAVINTLALSAPGFKATGAVGLKADGSLDQARFGNVQIGDWFKAPVVLTGRGKGRQPQISIQGGGIDLRRADIGGGGGAGGGGPPIDVSLERLTISKGLYLTAVRGQLSQGKGTSGKFTGRVNGGARITATLAPVRGGTAIRVNAADAGAVLRSAKVFQKSRDGTLDLILQPRGPAGEYDGKLTIKDTRVRGTPVLAELLSAISVVGILDLLNGDGLVFSQVDADFRLTRGAVQIKKGSAIGPSLGISMAGLYTTRDNRMDMQGVISPVYLLNGIGSVLTRKGEGLFGFNYRMIGNANDPKVQVNPLSILTPGMFREIFRRPPPRIGQ